MESHIMTVVPSLLFEGEAVGQQRVDLDFFDACEASMIRFEKGHIVPMHSHSNRTVKVVLEGRLEVTDELGNSREVGPGEIYVCSVWPYTATALEETLMLLLQPEGTHRVSAGHEH